MMITICRDFVTKLHLKFCLKRLKKVTKLLVDCESSNFVRQMNGDFFALSIGDYFKLVNVHGVDTKTKWMRSMLSTIIFSKFLGTQFWILYFIVFVSKINQNNCNEFNFIWNTDDYVFFVLFWSRECPTACPVEQVIDNVIQN